MSANILVVDDEEHVCNLTARWLEKEGYNCDTVYGAGDALALLQKNRYALLISDIMMPEISGVELLQKVKEQHPDVAVIMATAVDNRETAISALHLGAFGYIIKPFDTNELLINVANALERRRLTLVSKEYENRLEQEVREKTEDVRNREEEIALRLISAAGYRDEETGEHIKRLGLYSVVLAKKLGWKQDQMDLLRVAAPMHDVGKIGIPDFVLLKTDKLTPEEFDIIKNHTKIGERILKGSNIPLLQMATDIALCHHEKWDGSGYPQNLVGEAIPETARIVAIADVYDALSNDRVYRAALAEEGVLAIMNEGKGSHFDPTIFECFLETLPDFKEILKQYRDTISYNQ